METPTLRLLSLYTTEVLKILSYLLHLDVKDYMWSDDINQRQQILYFSFSEKICLRNNQKCLL